MQDKIYYPETINSFSLPGIIGEQSYLSSNNGYGVNAPESVKPVQFPSANFAQEVLSKNLNTQSKKILGSFSFNTSGAIVIGTYENGVTGDIKLSPNGIVARNSAGTTTFSIDGTTGSATFLGTLIAGSLFSGDIAIGAGNAIFKADSNGIYLGNATFASAPFRVSMAGAVTATSITLSNASIGSGSSWAGNAIAQAYIGNLTTSIITSGTFDPVFIPNLATSKITSGTFDPVRIPNLSADKITSGTINASVISVTNISASNISTGTLSADRIASSSISATKLSVSTLSSIVANLGTVTAGVLTGITRLNIGGSSTKPFYCYGTNIGTGGDMHVSGNLDSDHFDPNSSNLYNQGSDSTYWNFIYADDFINKSLGWYDDGVELQDGRKVSDLQALKEIKPDKVLKNKNGSPKLDSSTLPIPVYRQAFDRDRGKVFPRNKEGRPYNPKTKEVLTDSESLTHFVSLLFGALKEVDNKIEVLQLELDNIKLNPPKEVKVK